MRTQYQKLLDLVRQNYASVVWTHKIQEKQADIYEENYKKIECANIFTAAFTSCGVFSSFYQDVWFIKVGTIFLSFITVFIASYMKSFDLKTMGKDNKEYANRFLMIRNKLLSIIAEIHLMKKPIDEIQEQFEAVLKELNDCYANAPTTTYKAVTRASEALKVNKDYTFTDEEIDRFLPSSLRGELKGDYE